MLAVSLPTVNPNPSRRGWPTEAPAGLRLKLAVAVREPYDDGMQLNVDKCAAGLTAEEFLLRQIPAAPAGYLRQLFRQHKILCQQRPLAAATLLKQGGVLQLPASERLLALVRQAPALVIVHETGQLVLLDKPSGLAIHRTAETEPDLTSLLQALIKRRKEPYRVAPVTRLDRGTSGLVVFAKGKEAAGELGRQIMDRRWRKLYLALVQGTPPQAGILEAPVTAKGKLKPARTDFRCLHAAAGFALLEVDLQTGRSHQIRQQLAASGYPLVGDQRYGSPSPGLAERIFLHCVRLELPTTDPAAPMIFSAPLPQALQRSLKAIWGSDRN